MGLRRVIHVLFAAAALSPGTALSGEPNPDAPAAPHPLEGYWDLRMERTVLWPYAVAGSLAVWRGPTGLRGSVTFDPMWGIRPTPLRFESAEGDRARFQVEFSAEFRVPVEVTVRDGVLEGRVHWEWPKGSEDSVVHGELVRWTRRFDPGAASDAFPREEDPATLGVDPTALDRLISYAGRYDTDALVVVKDGKLVCDRRFLRPTGLCTLQSVTKAVASLAIPMLVEDGKLPRDLDTPLATWFPEWKADEARSRITLRHVLTHTTGLASDGTTAMQQQSNYLAFALKSAVIDPPGLKYAYSNQAIELLSGVIAKAAGEQADSYLAERVFKPLGITKWRWGRDGAGNTPTYAGIDMAAEDVARIGRLVASRGRWGEKQLVPAWWFDEAVRPSPANDEVGHVWWLLRRDEDEKVVQTQERLDRLRAAGCPDTEALNALVGQTFDGRRAWWAAAVKALGGGEERPRAVARFLGSNGVGGELRGAVSCVYHSGSLGQWLVVVPGADLVVVRQRRAFAEKELSDDVKARAEFSDITRLVLDLVPR